MSNFKYIFTTVILSILLSFTSSAFADFSQEAGVYIENNEDGKDAFDSIVPTYFYYFKPVSMTKGPVDEAPFMQHITWLRGTYAMTDGNFGTTDYEGTSTGITGEAYHEQIPAMLGFKYVKGEITYPAFAANKTDITQTEVSISYFIQPLMAISLKRYILESETTGPSSASTKITEDTVGFKIIMPQGNSQAISLVAEYTSAEDDDNDTYKITEVVGKYFLSNTFGVGGKYSKQTSPDSASYDNRTTIGGIFSMYINSQFHVDVKYDKTTADDSTSDDGNDLQVQATMLF